MSHTCVKCGQHEDCSYNAKTVEKLVERQLCFGCDYWWRYLNDDIPERDRHHHSTAIVANGNVYTDGGNIENLPRQGGFVGHGGHKFHIRMLDGSREWTTNNLWHGGAVPAGYRDEIPDTAEFVKPETKQVEF